MTDRRKTADWSVVYLYTHLLMRMGVRVRAAHVRVMMEGDIA